MASEMRITPAHVLQIVSSPRFYEKVPEFMSVKDNIPSVTLKVKNEAAKHQGCKACGIARKVQQAIIDLFVNTLVAQKHNTEAICNLKRYLTEDMNMSAERYILICKRQSSSLRVQVVF